MFYFRKKFFDDFSAPPRPRQLGRNGAPAQPHIEARLRAAGVEIQKSASNVSRTPMGSKTPGIAIGPIAKAQEDESGIQNA